MLKKLQLHLPKILLFTVILFSLNSWGQYTGTGTFNKITSTADLTDGYYIIVGNGTTQAMTSSHNGTFFSPVAVASGNTVSNPDVSIVWKIETSGGGRTIYNEASDVYASYAGSSNNVQISSSASTNNQRWTFTAGEPFLINNAAVNGRRLQYNVSSPRFACYTGSQTDIVLYKFQVPANPVVLSEPATNVDASSAIITGTIAIAGGSAVLEYGVEYSTSVNFEPGTGTAVLAYNLAGNTFSTTITNLEIDTVYYFRTFAANASGTSYSDQRAFTTLSVDTPIAVEATDITSGSFTANWTAAAAAESYRLDVSKLEDFGVITLGETIIETFDNMPTNSSGSYFERTWTGTDGIEWIANDARTDQTLTGRAITLRASELTNTTPITGGVTTLSFQYRRVFSGNSVLKVYVNDMQYGGDIAVSLETPTTYTQNINITGNATIKIQNIGERTVIDDLTITTPDTYVPDYLEGYENLTVNETSAQVTGLEHNTVYYYRVRAVAGDATSLNSNVISVETGVANIWNGEAWSMGTPPTINDEAIIAGDYDTAEDGEFEAALLTVSSGTFTISEGTSITVNGTIINNEEADFIIEDNANLLQIDSVNNTGNFQIVKKGSPLYRLDYTIWSSPVANQNLLSFSPNTLPNRFYIYNTETDEYSTVNPELINFEPGTGYLIRMPNGYPNTGNTTGYNDGLTTVGFEGLFIGTVNNGTIDVPLSVAGGGYNMIGNPYPSPVNIHQFYDLNTAAIDQSSALYFWRKTNDPDASSYATITKLAYAANDAAGGDTGGVTFTGNAENWVINPGQGFIVKATTGADLVFTNSMRRNVNNGQFFRTSENENTVSRLWLDIIGAEGGFSQSVIGYTDVTTNGIDYGWDGKAISSGVLSLYSLSGETALSIQARQQFIPDDVVPIGYTVAVAGNYTVKLSKNDGVFAGNQNVFIKDNATGTIHNLKESAYTFATEEGTFNERLEIMYQNEVLNIPDPVLDENSVVVYKSGNIIGINTGNALTTDVTVYDIRGSILYTQSGINSKKTSVNGLNPQQQVLIVSIATEKGKVSKKIIF